MNKYALAGMLAAGFAAGWLVNGWRLGTDIARIELSHSEAIADAERKARDTESGWHAALVEVQKYAKEKEDALSSDVASGRDDAKRLREQVNRLSRRPSACPSATDGGATVEPVAGVFAELLGELEELAGAYAAEAGRARIAGLACEAAYSVLANGGKAH